VLIPAETETMITYDKSLQIVRIFSAWPKDQRKIERAGVKPCGGHPKTGLFYRLPLAQFKWRIQLVKRVGNNLGNVGRKAGPKDSRPIKDPHPTEGL